MLITVLTILGIGLIIFVHELGHYWAARAVGIRVEAFSIGFGKKIWGFRRGHEEWKVCLIPLGGYVKMAGEDPTRPTTGKPYEFGSKKVWQRVLVISAGVIMNMIFALVVLVICFAVGVPFLSPLVGSVDVGSPAWQAGIQPGDRMLAVNGRRVLDFEDVPLEAAVSHGPVTLNIERDGEELTIVVRPDDEDGRGLPTIGVWNAWKRATVTEEVFDVEADGPQGKAARIMRDAGFQIGDEIVAVNGLAFEFAPRAWSSEQASGKPLLVTVRRGDELLDLEIQPERHPVEDAETPMIGVHVQQVVVDKVLHGSAAASMGLKPGDRILTINGAPIGAEGSIREAVGEGLDPRRAPEDETYRDPQVTFVVSRNGGESRTLRAALPTVRERRTLRESFSLKEDGLALQVLPGSSAEKAGMLSGDVVRAIDGHQVENFKEFAERVRKSEGRPITLELTRDGEKQTLVVTPEDRTTYVGLNYQLELPVEVVREPVSECLSVGYVYTGRMLKRIYRTLRSLVVGKVSPKHLGGIITIFTVSNAYAKRIGFMRMLLFLAVISINLAVINILPIPALDGGWLMFLVIEKIKGSPINERAMGYFQWAGIIFVVGLMLFVTWNDVRRLIS